tara:strand:+ start:360 stop:593 length:234 start_codon:yes stop_codon:yes gene_type:complete
MIDKFIYMNGYGLYVWSSFIFTLFSFASLYILIKFQLKREQEKFKKKFFYLDIQKSETVKKQGTYKEILAYSNISKI